jgi:hypothetical protein
MICGSLESVQRAEPLEIIRNSALALPDALFLEHGHPRGRERATPVSFVDGRRGHGLQVIIRCKSGRLARTAYKIGWPIRLRRRR